VSTRLIIIIRVERKVFIGPKIESRLPLTRGDCGKLGRLKCSWLEVVGEK